MEITECNVVVEEKKGSKAMNRERYP